MIRLMQSYDSQGKAYYGRRLWKTEEGDTDVIDPFDAEEDGINFGKAIPAWIGVRSEEDADWYAPGGEKAHGTILILMGNHKDEDTIMGDRSRKEALNSLTGERIYWADHIYIENRLWEIPKDVKISIKMPSNGNKSAWPKTKEEWVAGFRDENDSDKKITQLRTCQGAKKWIYHPYGIDISRLPVPINGTIDLQGAIPATVHWFLRSANFPQGWYKSYGYIAALYSNEIYERKESKESGTQNLFNRFGIFHPEIQRRLFLIIEPKPKSNQDVFGTYPGEARASLLCETTEGTAAELPWEDWAADFRTKIPAVISAEMKKIDSKVSTNEISL